MTQRLDHFDHTNLQTWKQRYFVNDTFWSKADGPVFLMIGGEGPADPTWLVADTEIMVNARKYNALVVMVEHRFYGASHPTPDLSLSSLKFLSSQQALADLAYFHSFAVDKFQLTPKNKWVCSGGSYPGSLSAWFRIKYPHLVVGAIATSAPVEAKLNFVEYLEVVRDSLNTTQHGAECVSAVKTANEELTTLLGHRSSWPVIEKMFKLDPPLQNELDVQNLAQSLAGNFMGIVQYNRVGRALPGTIDDLCSMMTNKTLGTELNRYAVVNSWLLESANQSSLDVSYSGLVAALRNTSWDAPASEGGRQWMFQTCSQFAFYQTSDSPSQPFGSLFPLSFSVQQCMDIFGSQFNNSAIAAAVKWTNVYYGGWNISTSVTNIVFPNGSIDPWHALGITSSLSETLIAIFIHGTAHCANMYPARADDPAELVSARLNITSAIGKWLQE